MIAKMKSLSMNKCLLVASLILVLFVLVAGLMPWPIALIRSYMNTEYTGNYAHRQFRAIACGQKVGKVLDAVGAPFLREKHTMARWFRFGCDRREFLVDFDGEVIGNSSNEQPIECTDNGTQFADLVDKLGIPISCRETQGLEFWTYSRRIHNTHYLRKALVVDTRTGTVLRVLDDLYID